MTETNERVTVDFDSQSYYLDGEYWESWDNYGEEMAGKINELLNELYEKKEILEVQLKSATDEIVKLESEINTLTDTCHDCCKEIRKENEQLKCGNKNLKATLNDFINICNRLQANPTDKQTLGVARDMLQNMGVDFE